MAGDETDESGELEKALAEDLAPIRRAITAAIADLRPILDRHPEVHNSLYNAIGMLEEANAMIEDAPNCIDGPDGFTPELG